MLGLFQKLLLGLILRLYSLSRLFKKKTLNFLLIVKRIFKAESKETKEMLKIYIKFSQNEASQTELDWANHQFRDLLKTFGFGALLILPFAPITLPFVIKLAQKLEIDILPDSLKNELNTK